MDADGKVTCLFVRPDGSRCRQSIVDSEGLCAFHGGHTDLRRAGRKGGSVPAGMGGQQGRSLRQFLQDNIPHASVLKAVQTGLDSDDQRQQLAASKIVLGEVAGDQDRAAVVPAAAQAPVYDYQAIQEKLEDIGVLLRPSLPAVVRALPVLWGRADEAERADFVDAVLRIAGREPNLCPSS